MRSKVKNIKKHICSQANNLCFYLVWYDLELKFRVILTKIYIINNNKNNIIN